jgi:hypothetical protein
MGTPFLLHDTKDSLAGSVLQWQYFGLIFRSTSPRPSRIEIPARTVIIVLSHISKDCRLVWFISISSPSLKHLYSPGKTICPCIARNHVGPFLGCVLKANHVVTLLIH